MITDFINEARYSESAALYAKLYNREITTADSATVRQFWVYLHEKLVDLGLNLENTGPNCRKTNNINKVEKKKQQHYSSYHVYRNSI